MNAVGRGLRSSLLMLSAAGALMTATAPAALAQTGEVVVRGAWVRVPDRTKDETALYMTIENNTAEKRSVVSVTCEQARFAEMHNMTMEGKLMKMAQIPKIDVSAKRKTSLQPNAMHIMLLELTTRPAVGDTVKGTLKLDDGTMVPFTAEVRK